MLLPMLLLCLLLLRCCLPGCSLRLLQRLCASPDVGLAQNPAPIYHFAQLQPAVGASLAQRRRIENWRPRRHALLFMYAPLLCTVCLSTGPIQQRPGKTPKGKVANGIGGVRLSVGPQTLHAYEAWLTRAARSGNSRTAASRHGPRRPL